MQTNPVLSFVLSVEKGHVAVVGAKYQKWAMKQGKRFDGKSARRVTLTLSDGSTIRKSFLSSHAEFIDWSASTNRFLRRPSQRRSAH